MTIRREYAVFEIAPDGRADFEALQGRMGMPLCASDTTEPEDQWWFSSEGSDGSVRRAFSFRDCDRVDLGGLVGAMGTTSTVRLSVAFVDIAGFQAEGSGAERIVRKRPPLLRPDQIRALYLATGRRRMA